MIYSLYVWLSLLFLIPCWSFLVGMRRLFDRDPVRWRTGSLFRKLGKIITHLHPTWRLHVSGEPVPPPGKPYVVVCNHQSIADIPFISTLPWEMKWMAKAELFKIPVLGWMMRWSGDIPVDRKSARSGARALAQAKSILARNCPVMIFPEGTRTPDGRVRGFSEGAFHLAIRTGVPILPLAIDGARTCIPKHGWRFGEASPVLLKVLPPIDTVGLSPREVNRLRDTVRMAIIAQIAAWRNVPVEAVDGDDQQ